MAEVTPTGVTLDAPPPQPTKSTNLMQARAESAGDQTGMLGSHPAVMSMQGLAMMRDGARLLGSAIPNIAPMLNQAIAQLEQIVPQEMSNAVTGAPMQPMGAAIPPMPPSPMGAPQQPPM